SPVFSVEFKTTLDIEARSCCGRAKEVNREEIMKARQKLQSHYDNISKLHLKKLFKENPRRGEMMTAEADSIFLDYSKNRISRETLDLLLLLADECQLQSRIDAMFRKKKINVTENRSVLHVALQTPKGTRIVIDGKDVVPDIHAILEKMADFSG